MKSQGMNMNCPALSCSSRKCVHCWRRRRRWQMRRPSSLVTSTSRLRLGCTGFAAGTNCQQCSNSRQQACVSSLPICCSRDFNSAPVSGVHRFCSRCGFSKWHPSCLKFCLRLAVVQSWRCSEEPLLRISSHNFQIPTSKCKLHVLTAVGSWSCHQKTARGCLGSTVAAAVAFLADAAGCVQ